MLNDASTELAKRQVTSAILDEERQKFEKQRHPKAQDRTAVKNHIEVEVMGKAWCRSGKECKPHDFFYSLRQPGTTLPVYETRSDKMAEIARNYHEGLQKDDIATMLHESALDGLHIRG